MTPPSPGPTDGPDTPVTPQQVRRALARAERGAALDVSEATALLAARGEDLERLTTVAARVRDRGLADAGRPGVVTYSPKVFIPVTRLCRDRCHYCTFVTTPGHLERAGEAPYLSPDEIVAIAAQGAELGCTEALFTLGDRPEDRWPGAREWLDQQGYDSTLAYVRAMAVRVLEETQRRRAADAGDRPGAARPTAAAAHGRAVAGPRARRRRRGVQARGRCPRCLRWDWPLDEG
jgi:FO synthase